MKNDRETREDDWTRDPSEIPCGRCKHRNQHHRVERPHACNTSGCNCPRYKSPSDLVVAKIGALHRSDLERALLGVVQILYLDESSYGTRWNPEKEWCSTDDLSAVADVLGFVGIYEVVEKAARRKR